MQKHFDKTQCREKGLPAQAGISTLILIIIIIAVAVVAVGGVFAYQYYSIQKEAKLPIVSTVPALLSFNIVPSEKSEQGTTYREGAEAVLKANNLSKVEFRQRGGGTEIYASPEGGLVGVGVKTVNGNEEVWKLALPSDRRFVELCVLGFDSSSNKVGEICLNEVAGASAQTADLSVLPTKIGQCGKTAVLKIGTRLQDASTDQNIEGSGSQIKYSNGISQVSYGTIQGIENSHIGDEINLCLVSIPKNCPVGDERGKIYKATNLRTGESWELPDSQHSCGGA